MEHQPFFSVIIPVYKVEQYLHECVDSVLCQTFRDLELILVDDGSPDRSGEICDEYQTADARVRAIHKANGGASDARNVGIRAASGSYLLFLDSDDYWDDAGALEKLHAIITGADKPVDVVIFQAKLLYPDGSMQPDRGVFPPEFDRMEPEESLVWLSQNGLLVGSACSKAVSRSFLIGNDLFFKVGIKCEDIHWLLRLADCLPRYAASDLLFYIYRKGRADSVTGSMDLRHLQNFADVLEYFCTYPYRNDTVRECLLGYVAYEFSILMASAANLPAGPDRQALYRRLRSMESVLDRDIHPKVKKINLVRRVLGFRGTMLLLGLYLKYRNR